MFGKKKNSRVINSLFEMYKIAHEALSSVYMEDVYTVDKYYKTHEAYSNTMLSVARAVSGEEGVLQLSTLCEQFHSNNVELLNRECEEIEEKALRDSEKEESVGMEGKYDGYVTTVTKSPVYSDRWQPTFSEQPWQPPIGERGWHAREGEMGFRGQEQPAATFVIGEGRGVESGPFRGADENPAVKYIYCIILIPPKDSSIDVLNERDKLINILRNKGFEAKAVYTDELSVYSEKLAAEFEEMFEPIYASTGIQCRCEVRCRGKAEPVVRCEEEDRK